MKLAISLVIVCVLSSLTASELNAQSTLLLRQPTLSDDHVVFVYADDLWVADRTGGDARRLTSHEGTESYPHDLAPWC